MVVAAPRGSCLRDPDGVAFVPRAAGTVQHLVQLAATVSLAFGPRFVEFDLAAP